MKQFILRGAWCLLSIFVLIGCQNDMEKEKELSFVDLSKVAFESIQFEGSESTQEIESGLSAEGWYVLSNADWVKAAKNGSKLVVTVSTNSGTTERSAILTLISGPQKKEVPILQAAPKLDKDVISADATELNIDQWAQSEAVYVSAPNSNWHAESSVDWIKVKTIPEHSKIEISFDENLEIEGREGEIRILDNLNNEVLQTISVKQDGVIYFIMPYQEVGVEFGVIREFETARMSTLTGKPDGFNNQEKYTFTTKSRIFKNMIYYVAGNYFYQVDIELNSEELQQDGILNKVLAFLQENGYEMQEDGKTLINSEKALKAFFGQDAKTQAVILHIANNPVQPKAYKTFDTFPPSPLYWNYTQKDEILKYEESIGSKVWEAQQKPIDDKAKAENKEVLEYWFLRNTPDSHVVYFVNETGETGGGQIVSTYNDITLGYYEFKGQYFLTNEFRALLEKSGYSISEYDYIFKKYDFIHSSGVKIMSYVSESRVNEGGPMVMWLSTQEP